MDSHIHYQWLRLLPSPSLIHTMVIRDCCEHGSAHLKFLSALFGCPALPTIKHLAIDGTSASPINRLMALSDLESLQIGAFISTRGYVSRLSPSLRRLSANVDTYDPDIRSVVQSLRHSLTMFNLNVFLWEQGDAEFIDAAAKLTRDLSSMIQLKHLTISHLQFSTSCTTPFLDDVIEHLPVLETMYASSGTFTGRLLGRVPCTLHTLRLETILPLTEEIMRLCARKQEGTSRLQLLELGSLRDDRLCRPLLPDASSELIGLCAAVGIALGRLDLGYWFHDELDGHSEYHTTWDKIVTV